jgi:hypothetical protein
VLRKRLMVLLLAVMMVVMSAAPAMAVWAPHEGCGIKENPQGHEIATCRKAPAGNQLDDSPDRDQGGGNDHIKTNRGSGND